MSALPIVLSIDPGVNPAPFARAFAGELDCRGAVVAGERDRVVALVTGIEPIGEAQIAPYPSLRVVLTCSTGVDHLDIRTLRARGLTVCHTPTYCSEEVADHALAMVLAGWRGLWRLGADVRDGRWAPETVLRRFDRQRLGIIGLGRIGARLARRAVALGIEVVAVDALAVPGEGVHMVELDELLATADAISLHLPARPGAAPVLGAAEIARIKPGAVVVNLARAALVDLDALLAALRDGALDCVASDVWPSEPPAADPRLQTPGLLVTPHVGWSSPEAAQAWQDEAITALRGVLISGAQPAGVLP